ncbi:Ileal sodium/bile acid cotransporter-like [Plakobranchus ocellatus]|uniref:Ileal sodium/bile acid cotransporter-like n=1 Tax=Plakobranchus ocellatus TaxID=259542 RepID=A0AAV4BX88_9GAST|nr:Ileal sodium/bile acid cotransporter-like [Plakobranchus ocellatus]
MACVKGNQFLKGFRFILLFILIFPLDITIAQINEGPEKTTGLLKSAGHPVQARAIPNKGKPGMLLFNLRSTNQVQVQYTVHCFTWDTAYQLIVMASNLHVAVIKDGGSYNVSCANAIGLDEHSNRISSEVEAGTLSTEKPTDRVKASPDHRVLGNDTRTGNSPYVGVVNSTFNLTLKARNIGRSFFIIIAEKLSGPDMPPGWEIARNNNKPKNQDATDVVDQDGYDRDNSGGKSPIKAAGSEKRLHKDQVGLSMIIVMQLPRTIDQIFQIVLRCVIVLATAGMGLKVKVKVVKQVLKKPIGPIIGFCCQFLFMPLVSL